MQRLHGEFDREDIPKPPPRMSIQFGLSVLFVSFSYHVVSESGQLRGLSHHAGESPSKDPQAFSGFYPC